ncbi:Coiled-coil domain-containing protein 13 [Chytriomyces hyalinus]|nr:Coiled-coil domain-containing protein 13 [Chytriomyces hyalinus]
MSDSDSNDGHETDVPAVQPNADSDYGLDLPDFTQDAYSTQAPKSKIPLKKALSTSTLLPALKRTPSNVIATPDFPKPTVREAKIIELSKKLRNMTLALEREKSSKTDLSNKLKVLQTLSEKTATDSATSPHVSNTSANPSSTAMASELKSVKEKLVQTVRKLEEERIANQSLKSELRNTQKALVMEIGDDRGVHAGAKVLDGLMAAGWKGRAQQIHILKERVKELSLRASATLPAAPVLQRQLPADSNPGFESHRTNQTQHQQQDNLRRISERRQETHDQLHADFNTLTNEHSELKLKYEGTIARNKCLDKEIKSLKSKIQLLIDKTTNDDKLIKAMHSELEYHQGLRDMKKKEERKLETVTF